MADQRSNHLKATLSRAEPALLLAKVRSSKIHGRGLFATRHLPARKKLGEIGGTLVKLPEARRQVESRRRIYLVELSRRHALDCSRGNCFRFLNHSCRPTCYLRIYRWRVEVYTLASIPPGAELTVDYGVTPHRKGMRCSCGAGTCRAVL